MRHVLEGNQTAQDNFAVTFATGSANMTQNLYFWPNTYQSKDSLTLSDKCRISFALALFLISFRVGVARVPPVDLLVPCIFLSLDIAFYSSFYKTVIFDRSLGCFLTLQIILVWIVVNIRKLSKIRNPERKPKSKSCFSRSTWRRLLWSFFPIRNFLSPNEDNFTNFRKWSIKRPKNNKPKAEFLARCSTSLEFVNKLLSSSSSALLLFCWVLCQLLAKW